MIPEPPQVRQTVAAQAASKGQVNRWLQWYTFIADWLIRNPGRPLREAAQHFGKSEAYLGNIVRSDLFQDYLARRKRAWVEQHDFAIRSKLTGVVEASLDNLLDSLQAKGNQLPAQVLAEVAKTGLDRLGFGTSQQPSVVINNQVDNRQVVLPNAVTPAALEEARQAMRLAEQRRAIEARDSLLLESGGAEAEPSSSVGTSDGAGTSDEGSSNEAT